MISLPWVDDLAMLKAQRARFDPVVAQHCATYLAEKKAKAATEMQRTQARAELDQYRGQVFLAYGAYINDYLSRFSATFRLGEVQSVNTRSGSSASYCVVINHQNVNVTSDEGPSFRNTLSSGDRNTLALAFFFASLDMDPNLSKKVVVFDDPMTSLDEHRSQRTRDSNQGDGGQGTADDCAISLQTLPLQSLGTGGQECYVSDADKSGGWRLRDL